MKKLICILLISSFGFGALPPLAQSIRELKALVDDPRLYQSLGSAEVIEEISRTNGGYLVFTKNYSMHVGVTILRNHKERVGPVEFELQFEKPVDLKTGQVKS